MFIHTADPAEFWKPIDYSNERWLEMALFENRRFNDRSGQQQEKTEWHRLTFWERMADLVEQYVHKGDRLYVELQRHGLASERLQRLEDGSGPLFRRRYRVRIEGGRLTPEQLMAEMLRDPNRAAPIEVAVFRKTRGGEGPLAVGDEFVVRMPGPWDGPVVVVDRTPTSFRFATLEGHLEAGQIEFRTSAGGGDAVCFEIESWARSGDRLSGLLFDRVKLAKEMQLHMWTHFCERAAKLAGGRIRGLPRYHNLTDEEALALKFPLAA